MSDLPDNRDREPYLDQIQQLVTGIAADIRELNRQIHTCIVVLESSSDDPAAVRRVARNLRRISDRISDPKSLSARSGNFTLDH